MVLPVVGTLMSSSWLVASSEYPGILHPLQLQRSRCLAGFSRNISLDDGQHERSRSGPAVVYCSGGSSTSFRVQSRLLKYCK